MKHAENRKEAQPGSQQANRAAERADALKDLGARAKERREQGGMSLEDVYDRTRIRMEYLQGIEHGNYNGFPDAVYVRGFVRTYLGVIGAVDLKDEFMRWLERPLKNPAKEKTAAGPVNLFGNNPFPTRGFKPASRFWLFLLLFLLVIGAGGYVWYSWSHSPLSFYELRGRGPSAMLNGLASQDVASGEVYPLASFDAAGQMAIVPSSISIEPETPPEPKPAPTIAFRADKNRDAWMKVVISGDSVFAKTLKRGAEISFDLTGTARVTFGRPSAVSVTLNGEDLGSPNPKGSRKSETYLYEPDGTWKKVDKDD